ncbi:MAG: hypothetical protein ABR909_11885 [Candidatus Bathyarchaeia archaeon]
MDTNFYHPTESLEVVDAKGLYDYYFQELFFMPSTTALALR